MGTMILKAATQTGAIITAKGSTIGEIADEIGSAPKDVWRCIRRHCVGAARCGKKPNIEPEHWLWQHKGDISTIKVIRNADNPMIHRESGLSAGRNAIKD